MCFDKFFKNPFLKTKFAFSIIEILVALIVVSVILAALAPIITKRTQSNNLSIASGNSAAVSDITTDCQNNPNFGSSCRLCTSQFCIDCSLSTCADNQYPDAKECRCKTCSEKYGTLCSTCDSTSCKSCNNASYYIKDGVCTQCPSGSYCDGKTLYATCPGNGYYCNSDGIHKCSEKFSLGCATCTSSACTKCNNEYLLSGNDCIKCPANCQTCTSSTYCTKCYTNFSMDTSTHTCLKSCAAVLTGCLRCSSSTVCTVCSGGYFLNSNKQCSKCTLANCSKCVDNVNSASPACDTCLAGYYSANNGVCSTCSSKYGANCAVCDTTQCLACTLNYHLDENNNCVSDGNKFNCSDTNFMKIGNLCFTRRNMGDSGALPLSSNAIKTNAKSSEVCYSENEKCCWVGQTSNTSSCDSYKLGDYSGCNRTVCNWEAAKDICANFKYGGLSWRLPTNEELKNLAFTYSIGLKNDGLQLCEASVLVNSTTCQNGSSDGGYCKGSYDNICYPCIVWSGTEATYSTAYAHTLYGGQYTYTSQYRSKAFSVRCVAEL